MITERDANRHLKDYENELREILGRFRRSRDCCAIHPDDDPRFRQLVIELRDFLNDVLGQNNYSAMIANHFAEGVSNFTGSPSYKSVENILGVVKSVITRIGRNPDILKASAHSADEVAPSRCEPTYPERITVAWLKEHVPVGIWLTGLALLASAFIAGVQASKLTLVKELFGL